MMSTPIDRPRIFSHLTRTRFLHIEDSLERGNPGEQLTRITNFRRGKLRFFIGSFEKGRGASSTAYAFMDVDDARVVLSDLSWGKAVDFIDFKGGKDASGAVLSRVLKITTKGDNASAAQRVWLELQNGPGEELPGGAVKPLGKALAEISVPLTIFEGRKLAHACLAYVHAWEVARLVRLSGPQPEQEVINRWIDV
jgi:hypothetical protein